MKLSFKKGFTLVELLVVVGIIAILSAVLVPNVAGIRAKSRDTKRIADISQYRLALEHYYTLNRKYPAALANLSGGGIISSPVPTDPSGSSYWNSGDYKYVAYCNGGGSDPNGYHLMAKLESNNEQLKGDSDGTATGIAPYLRCGGTDTDQDGADSSSGYYYDLVNN